MSFFDGPEDRVEPGFPGRIEHPGQVDAERFGDQGQEPDEEGELQPVVRVHGRGSEFFRVDHGHQEVADEQEGDDADDEGFHGDGELERAAEAGVERADGEEGDGHGDEQQIGHGDGGG